MKKLFLILSVILISCQKVNNPVACDEVTYLKDVYYLGITPSGWSYIRTDSIYVDSVWCGSELDSLLINWKMTDSITGNKLETYRYEFKHNGY